MNTENTVMREREISLMDLMVEILLRWRTVLIVMLMGGVLFAGISYMKSVNTAKEQQAALDRQNQYMMEQSQQLSEEEAAELESANRQELEEQLTETQIYNVNNAILYEERYKEMEAYKKSSFLMQMDPLHVQQAELTFLIRTDDLERTYNIEKVYEDLLVSTALYDYVKEQCNIEKDISNLISLEKTSYGEMQGSDTVRIRVIYGEADVCQAIANTIVSYVTEQRKALVSQLGDHEVVLLSQSLGEVVSTDILNQQEDCDSDIVSLRNSAIKLKAAFTDEEWHYYDYLVKAKATESSYAGRENEDVQENIVGTMDTIKVTAPGISVKYILLGMILFAFVYVAIIFVMYSFNSKIRITDNLEKLYGIAQLGAISADEEKKKILGVIDQWILKLRYLGKRRFAPEESIALAATAVKMAAKKNNLAEVCLIGCNLSERSMQICERIQAELKEEQIVVKMLNNILYDVEAMEKVGSVPSAVLVESCGSSLYQEIESEIQLLSRQNIKVLGGIVVE